MDHIAVDIGEALVVEAHQVEQGGMEVAVVRSSSRRSASADWKMTNGWLDEAERTELQSTPTGGIVHFSMCS